MFLKPYFSELQFGFRKQRFYLIQLLKFLDQVYNSLNYDDEIHVVYTDNEKTFDNVDHGILLEKLYRMGNRGKNFKSLPSYLANRKQCVRVDGKFLQEVVLPQVSILASLLFVIYINDQTNNCETCQPILCTDVAKLISSNQSTLQLQLELSCIERWSDRNKIPVNIRKCSHLDCGTIDKLFFFFGNEKKRNRSCKKFGFVDFPWPQLNWSYKSSLQQSTQSSLVEKKFSPRYNAS